MHINIFEQHYRKKFDPNDVRHNNGIFIFLAKIFDSVRMIYNKLSQIDDQTFNYLFPVLLAPENAFDYERDEFFDEDTGQRLKKLISYRVAGRL